MRYPDLAAEAAIGLWRSLVAHLTGGQGVAGSNPVSPTRRNPCQVRVAGPAGVQQPPTGSQPAVERLGSRNCRPSTGHSAHRLKHHARDMSVPCQSRSAWRDSSGAPEAGQACPR